MLPEIDQFLACSTPAAWVEAALERQDVMLLDHKACEMKAAATAMQLIGKYSGRLDLVYKRQDLVNKMSRLAREELRHFEQVLAILKKRGIRVVNVSASRYASALRDLVRKQEPQRLTDTLVVGAFIEARSCERFAALVPHLDAELAKFYGGLLKSESRHFQDYLKLAYQYGDEADVERTIEVVRAKEAELISSPDNEFRFHSGLPVDLVA